MSDGVVESAPSLLFDAAGLAQALDVSKRHVERLDAAGRCPKPVRIGRAKRWSRAEIETWIAAGCPDRRTWQSQRRTS